MTKYGLVCVYALLLAALAVGCTPEGGCKSTITGDSNSVTQACGGSGEGASPGTVTTPAPVIVNPPVFSPVPVEPAEGGE
jgi:hypothetical protein